MAELGYFVPLAKAGKCADHDTCMALPNRRAGDIFAGSALVKNGR